MTYPGLCNNRCSDNTTVNTHAARPGFSDYIPPAEETAQLGYDRGVIREEIEDCVRYYGGQPMA